MGKMAAAKSAPLANSITQVIRQDKSMKRFLLLNSDHDVHNDVYIQFNRNPLYMKKSTAVYVDRGSRTEFEYTSARADLAKFHAWTRNVYFELTPVIWNGEFTGLKAKFSNGNRARFILEIQDYDFELRYSKNEYIPRLEKKYDF